jgi:glycosyltransferase involved in cell wall biosynthesis
MELTYALVHEWLTPKATGGSEIVVKEILSKINADLYALIDYESSNPNSYLYQRKIGTTFLQNLPQVESKIQNYLPLFPYAIEQLDLREYNIILSSAHAVAKGIITTPEQLHICYCHTPMRYAWDLTFDYLNQSKLGQGAIGILTRYLLHQLRQWDVISANRVDHFIANSHYTASRIWRCYRRESKVIYPPVDVDYFPYSEDKDDFYLTVSRLVGYKQVKLIVEAFNNSGKNLVVIGTGPELTSLQQIAKSNIKVLGYQPREILANYLSKAKALIYTACEDFGIILVEAQACGTPVIAYGKGGALETVIDIRHNPQLGTGLLFQEQSSMSIEKAVTDWEENKIHFCSENSRHNAHKFRTAVFHQQYLNLTTELIDNRFAKHLF